MNKNNLCIFVFESNSASKASKNFHKTDSYVEKINGLYERNRVLTAMMERTH